jgi:cysteinyl-tRNA synthetase
MELRLYDTLTREKRLFQPLDPNNVRMYVCGPTVYDFAHIGNARPVIVFDVLFRLLRHLYGADHVTYVRNITDVDDKINDRAARDYPGMPLNEAIREVTEETGRQFHADVDALGCLRPTVEPRATEHIGEMRAIIEKLVAGGFAYVAEDHVLFSPQAMNAADGVLPRYGALAKRSLDEMIAGARVDVAPYKRDVTDFVLWKPSKPGEPSWPSPAGIAAPGRPGWHVECSAMAWKHLGEHFDIHGGGIDLVFPHHENEVAQSCCAFHQSRMANYWMHNGFLQVEGDKMSKSLGNFVTIRDLLADWPGEVLRLNMLKTHYRSPIDWTLKALEESAKTLDDWYRIAADAQPGKPATSVVEPLLDDLNTPQMIAALHGLRNDAVSGDGGGFAASLRLLGFLAESAAEWEGRKRQASGIDVSEINRLISERSGARARKDFKESDRIRDQLAAMGVAIKDSKDGTTWEIAR